MIFQGKLKKMVDVEAAEKRIKEFGKPELEKGDMLAISIAAVRVFLPRLLAFIGVIYLVFKLFVR